MLRQEASIVDDIEDGAAHDAHTQHQQTVSRHANASRPSQRLAALLGACAQGVCSAEREQRGNRTCAQAHCKDKARF